MDIGRPPALNSTTSSRQRGGWTIAVCAVALLAIACSRDAPEPPPSPPTRPPWAEHELGTHAAFRDIVFLDADRGWIVGGAYGVPGGLIGRTSDGGRTWAFESGIAAQGDGSGGLHLNAIRFLDERTAVIAANNGLILRSVDGGRRWHRVHRVAGVAAHLTDLDFVDDDHGWAVGPGGLVATSDGGRTWASPVSGESEPGVSGRGLDFVNARLGFVVGTSGSVLRTLDGGRTWTRVFHAPGLRLWAVAFHGRERGWAVGERGRIIATIDGGTTWSEQHAGRQLFLRDVAFLDGLRGRAVGFHRPSGMSTILQTVDGGASWTPELELEQEALLALYFLDDRHGWAVGERVYPRPQRLLRYAP